VRREWINILLVMLLVAVAGILLFSLLPERQAMYLFENSDALYMPALYQDLFVHRSGLSVWHLNGAPNFFPEMLLFFPLMAVLKSTSLTIMVYGVVQMLLIMFLMDRFLHLADMQISKITRYLVLLSFLLFQKGKKKSYLVLITLAGLTTLLALFIYRMMNFLPAIDMISTGTKMFQFDQIPKAMGNFLHHMKSVIIEYPIQRLLLLATLLFILGAPVFLIRHLSLYLARKLNPGMDNSYALILYLSLFVLLILFTPIINGYYVGRSLIRYNYAALVIGAAGFVYLAAVLLSSYKAPRWFKKYFTRACTTLLLAILLMVGVKNQALKGLRNYVNHYPESVRVLDELKREHGLAYGLSGYWQAKHSTMFSRNNLRLYAVSNGSFKPSYHVTNENWFHDGGKGSHANPVFNFLETSAFNDTEKLKELFGKHIDTLYDQNDLLVIKVPDFKMERESREIYLLDP
jgi:hypothetical protein